MKNSSKTIKIKLDAPAGSVANVRSLERWENEGGRSGSLSEAFPFLDFPFHTGDVFRVRDGRVEFEDGEFYYISEIEKINP